jgi:chromosome segregation ATPase
MSILGDLVAEISRCTDQETMLSSPSYELQAELASAKLMLTVAMLEVRDGAIRRRRELRRELSQLNNHLCSYDSARREMCRVRLEIEREQEERYRLLVRLEARTNRLIDRLDALDPEWRQRAANGGPILRLDHADYEVSDDNHD